MNRLPAGMNGNRLVGSFLDEGFLIGHLTDDVPLSVNSNKSRRRIALFLEGMKDFFNDEILGGKKLIRDLSKGNQKKWVSLPR